MYIDDPTLSDRVAEAERSYERMVVEMICKGLSRVRTLSFGSLESAYKLTDSVSHLPNRYDESENIDFVNIGMSGMAGRVQGSTRLLSQCHPI